MIELNKIYNENNCETMARMDDNSIDLTVTSPPYDNLRLYQGYSFNFERVAQELFRVTKEGGVVVWVVNDATENGSETLTSFKQAIYFREKCGFNLHDTMIYKAKKPPLTHNRYEQEFEYMFILSKGKPTTFNPIMEKKDYVDNRTVKNIRREKDGTFDVGYIKKTDERMKYNIWEFATGGGLSSTDKIAFGHPAIFPEKLAQDHILSWSNEGEVVYDPFMGSGTVAKMCIKTNRNYVGSEISQEYCTLAEKRILPYKQEIDMFYKVS